MALVIGHSQTKYFKNYFDPKDNVEVLCYPGCKVEDLILKDEVAEAVPRASVIVILCGINNIPRDDYLTLMEKFDDLYTFIRIRNKSCHLVVSEVLPRVQSSFPGGKRLSVSDLVLIGQTIEKTNQCLRLAPLCDEKLHYLNFSDFLTCDGSVNTRLLSKDGLQLSFKGTQYVTEEIARAIHVLSNNVTNFRPVEQLELSMSEVTDTTDKEHVVQTDMEISYGPYRYSDTVKLLFKKQGLFKQKPGSITSKRLMKSSHKFVVQRWKMKRSFNSQCKKTSVSKTNKGGKIIKNSPQENEKHNSVPVNKFCLLKNYKPKEVLTDNKCNPSQPRNSKNSKKTSRHHKKANSQENEFIDKLVSFIEAPSSVVSEEYGGKSAKQRVSEVKQSAKTCVSQKQTGGGGGNEPDQTMSASVQIQSESRGGNTQNQTMSESVQIQSEGRGGNEQAQLQSEGRGGNEPDQTVSEFVQIQSEGRGGNEQMQIQSEGRGGNEQVQIHSEGRGGNEQVQIQSEGRGGNKPDQTVSESVQNQVEGRGGAEPDQLQEGISENVYMQRNKELSPLEVLDILNKVDVNRIAKEIDFRPKGGNIFFVCSKPVCFEGRGLEM